MKRLVAAALVVSVLVAVRPTAPRTHAQGPVHAPVAGCTRISATTTSCVTFQIRYDVP